MLIRASVALAAICLFSNAVAAQDAAPQEPAKDKKICRTVTPTGSMMGKRVCLTKAEWAKLNGAYSKQNADFRDRQDHSTAIQ